MHTTAVPCEKRSRLTSRGNRDSVQGYGMSREHDCNLMAAEQQKRYRGLTINFPNTAVEYYPGIHSTADPRRDMLFRSFWALADEQTIPAMAKPLRLPWTGCHLSATLPRIPSPTSYKVIVQGARHFLERYGLLGESPLRFQLHCSR